MSDIEEKGRLSHVDEKGRVRMVDVGNKPPMRRRAVAETYFHAAKSTLDAIFTGTLPKGEALAAARIAGIQAAKRCGELIPLCHPLPLDVVEVNFERMDDCVRIETAAATTAKTGVEMEALTAASVAALTLYDMTKAVDKSMHVEGLRLLSKTKELLT
ncbi:MAG TPA: cyclic pyranopterin monophosphate synthase MoaC [Phycisphaeraceae bacterium]|nr:cyclic pyranopterin monophosphate synthase MoaC [Phycisphaeraceae bacterium]